MSAQVEWPPTRRLCLREFIAIAPVTTTDACGQQHREGYRHDKKLIPHGS
jgi:hypothetical protein